MEYIRNILSSGQILYKKCECGFNIEGIANCPSGHNQNIKIWLKYFKALIRKFDNTCHTLSRYNRFLSNKYALSDISSYSHYLGKGHIFNKAARCEVKVIDGNYIKNKLIETIIIGVIILG